MKIQLPFSSGPGAVSAHSLTNTPGRIYRPALFGYMLFAWLCLCFVLSASAQSNANIDGVDTDPKPFLITLTTGTTGLGLEAKKMLGHNFGAKAGFSFLPQLSVMRTATTDFNNESKYSGNFSKAQLLFEYSPFEAQGIRLVGGGAYLFSLKTNVSRYATGNYKYGDIVFTPADIGEVNTMADWKGPAAYAGLGFFRIIPQRSFNVTVDLGAYYLSSPATSISGTQMLAVNGSTNNREHWQANIGQYRWLPVLQLNFNYKIGN